MAFFGSYIWHIFILPPSTFRMVKNYFFEVTQNKFYNLIWLLKFNMPSNETKNEKAGPNMGLNYTPKVGCFFKIVKIQLFLLLQ